MKLVSEPAPAPDLNMEGGPRPLPRPVVEKLVGRFLEQRQRFLAVAGERGTPLYVFDPEALERGQRRFSGAFASVLPDFKLCYALKSNSHPLLVRKLVELGAGLDVSSGLELKAGLAVGCGEMVFSGPGKTPEELLLAVRHSEKVTVLLDSFGELDRLEQAARSLGQRVNAGVRLSTKSDGPWRKFGIPLEALGEFWRRAAGREHIRFCGLQFHNSWNLDPQAQVAFIGQLGECLRGQDPGLLAAIRFLDLGGGFWPEKGEWLQGPAQASGSEAPRPLYNPARSIEHFARAIGQALEEHVFSLLSCRILAEPGRWLCDGAMHLLLRVLDKKAPDLAITDGGIHLVGWERFESDYAPIINLSRPSLTEKACLVCGSLCTPHDLWGHGYFGGQIQEGDLLLIPDQGAYTYSLRQNFIKPAAASAVLPAA